MCERGARERIRSRATLGTIFAHFRSFFTEDISNERPVFRMRFRLADEVTRSAGTLFRTNTRVSPSISQFCTLRFHMKNLMDSWPLIEVGLGTREIRVFCEVSCAELIREIPRHGPSRRLERSGAAIPAWRGGRATHAGVDYRWTRPGRDTEGHRRTAHPARPFSDRRGARDRVRPTLERRSVCQARVPEIVPGPGKRIVRGTIGARGESDPGFTSPNSGTMSTLAIDVERTAQNGVTSSVSARCPGPIPKMPHRMFTRRRSQEYLSIVEIELPPPQEVFDNPTTVARGSPRRARIDRSRPR